MMSLKTAKLVTCIKMMLTKPCFGVAQARVLDLTLVWQNSLETFSGHFEEFHLKTHSTSFFKFRTS